MDLVGPLPVPSGYFYLLTVVHHATSWPEAFPLTSISAQDCILDFYSGWVTEFGVPLHFTSDKR